MRLLLGLIFSLAFGYSAHAKDAVVELVELENNGVNWTVRVTIKHDDEGYKHYADSWRIVDAKKKVLLQKDIYHPHQKDKPFTELHADLVIPAKTKFLYVEVHAKSHGWSKKRVKIDMTKNKGQHYNIMSGKK